MGVDIADLLETREIEIKDLMGRKIAIDALNTLYQFMSIIRQPDGSPLKDSKGRITSHFSGLFYRTGKLLENGIKPCFVFDGKPPEFKAKTNIERRERREDARKKYKQALRKGKVEEAKKYASMSVEVEKDIIEESKKLLDIMGIPYVQAPSEGEAQAAYMVNKGDMWAVGSQDFDSLIFGAKKLLRNVTITGKRKLPGKKEYVEVKPNIINLEENLRNLDIDRKKLVSIAICVGTDYNPGGIKGIGPKKALNLVKKRGDLASVMKGVDWDFDIKPGKIRDFFLNPPVKKDYSVKWTDPDEDRIKEFLCEKYEFSEDRIINTLEKIKKSNKSTQTRLDFWG